MIAEISCRSCPAMTTGEEWPCGLLFSRDVIGRNDLRIGCPRRRPRRRQGKGGDLRGLPRRKRHFADREHSLARGPARSVHSVAAGLLPRRCAQERTDAADRRADQQRGHPHSRRLFRVADPAQGARPTTIPICRRRARRRPRAGAAPDATPIRLRERKAVARSPASARNIWSRRCMTTNRARGSAAAWRRWPTSPIPSATRKSRRSRIIWRICNGAR